MGRTAKIGPMRIHTTKTGDVKVNFFSGLRRPRLRTGRSYSHAYVTTNGVGYNKTDNTKHIPNKKKEFYRSSELLSDADKAKFFLHLKTTGKPRKRLSPTFVLVLLAGIVLIACCFVFFWPFWIYLVIQTFFLIALMCIHAIEYIDAPIIELEYQNLDKYGFFKRFSEGFTSLQTNQFVWSGKDDRTVVDCCITDDIDRIHLNIKVPCIIDSNNKKYCFMPDSLWIFNDGEICHFNYSQLKFDFSEISIEDYVYQPTDSISLESHWLHSNKDGGKDLRYNDNPLISKNKYGVISIMSNEILIVSLVLSNFRTRDEFLTKVFQR